SAAPGTATGTVTFMDGVTTLGTGALSGGTATLTTSALTAGTHSITAVYGGDTNFVGGTSAAVPETIGHAAPAVALATSVNPSVSGQAVTFTATVTAGSPGSGTPTGSVTFFDGVTAL